MRPQSFVKCKVSFADLEVQTSVLTVDAEAEWNSENPRIKDNCYEVAFEEPCYMCLV